VNGGVLDKKHGQTLIHYAAMGVFSKSVTLRICALQAPEADAEFAENVNQLSPRLPLGGQIWVAVSIYVLVDSFDI
jgi:hypothetical protein